MTDKNVATFAIFKDQADVERAVDALKASQFRNSDISVLLPDKNSTRDFAHEKATKAPEGATTGGATGALLGGTFGWLVGMGSLVIPGVGPFIAAGPIMAALAGAGIGTALGSVTGALVGMGIPEYEAKRYEGIVKNGGILLSVHCATDEDIKRAKKVLEATGGQDIAATAEAASGEDLQSKNTIYPSSRDSSLTSTGTNPVGKTSAQWPRQDPDDVVHRPN